VRGQSTSAGTSQPRSTYLVKRLQEAMRLRLDQITGQFGLTIRQWMTLSVLQLHPGISAAQLARLTFVSTQAANDVVVILGQKGLLQRSVDERNRRCLEVELTRAGAKALARCDAQVDELEDEVFSGLSARDVEHFRRTLQVCIAALATPRSSA
jgi:DNA-binding MarR family transcriptional regulator